MIEREKGFYEDGESMERGVDKQTKKKKKREREGRMQVHK